MISRCCVECVGCAGAVCLRISISGEAEQRFAVACPHCGAALQGKLTTNPDKGLIVALHLDGQLATLVEETDATPVVNVATDVLMDPTARSMVDPGGSAFLMHVSVLGQEPYLNWRTRLERFELLTERDWQNLVRWWSYYTSGRWALFDSHAAKVWSEHWPDDPSDLARHDSIHRILDTILLHISGRTFIEMNAKARSGFPGPFPGAFEGLSRSLETSGLLASAQSQLFEVLDEFVRKQREWKPGSLAVAYDEAGVARDPSWRIQRDDFISLRGLYLSCFERSYRFVDVPMLLGNVIERGDAGSFPDRESRSLRNLARLRPAEKEKVLVGYSWGEQFIELFDRSLRNAIGHADARHDVALGSIISPKGSWSYVEFVANVVRSAQAPLFVLSITKLLRIMAGMPSDGEASVD